MLGRLSLHSGHVVRAEDMGTSLGELEAAILRQARRFVGVEVPRRDLIVETREHRAVPPEVEDFSGSGGSIPRGFEKATDAQWRVRRQTAGSISNGQAANGFDEDTPRFRQSLSMAICGGPNWFNFAAGIALSR